MQKNEIALPDLPENPLPSLADEILAELPALIEQHPTGLTIKIATDHFGIRPIDARNALRQLNFEGRAVLMRRIDGREEFLVPFFYRQAPGLRCCSNCGKAFKLRTVRRQKLSTKYDNRKCCTRWCSISWTWKRPDVRSRRIAGQRAERQTDKAKARLVAHNKKRWSRPGERARLSAWNRKRWADPAIKADLSRAIALVQRSPEMRKLYSELRKLDWKDPAYRKKMLAAVRKGHGTPEYRAMFSELLRERWRDPVMRKKYVGGIRRFNREKKNAKKKKPRNPQTSPCSA